MSSSNSMFRNLCSLKSLQRKWKKELSDCTQLLKCDDKRHALHRLLGADGDYWAFEKCKTMDVMYEECYEYPELHKLMYRVQEKIAYLRRRDTSPYYK
ncbi:unnamed protein product [Caenorhabditis brenneri]